MNDDDDETLRAQYEASFDGDDGGYRESFDDEDEVTPDLGSCCLCESTVDVFTVLMIRKKAPLPGRGWGCVVCGLPSDGALAVVCNTCAEQLETVGEDPATLLRFACRGYPGPDGRVPIESLTGTHDHDRSRHPPEDWPQ